jgi:hypothetical protein
MKPQTLTNKELKNFLQTKKRDSRLVGAVERHILSKDFEDRDQTVLHPSDMIKAEWCALAAYHALNGNYVETKERPTLRTQSIFDEGHAIHAKWQRYLTEMGVLYGKWVDGKKVYWRKADAIGKHAKYAEVPLVSKKHRIAGHSDGWVKGLGEDYLIEIKSMGAGTFRFEAPALLAEAGGNLEKAWGLIRQPFRSHQLQGQVYLHLCHLMVEEGLLESAPEEIVFIYELKANQDYKEFTVMYNPEFTKDIFDRALDVVWAVDNKRPPQCTIDSVKGCKRCAPFKETKDANV